MENIIQEVLANNLGVNLEDINDSTSINDCDNWDSMKTLFIVSDLESEFQIQFEPEQIERMNSFKKICEVINNILNEKEKS
tara:strand:+ start:260 stop:502 length:243 start_codon:yes stop_codon:yes gene_type:complete